MTRKPIDCVNDGDDYMANLSHSLTVYIVVIYFSIYWEGERERDVLWFVSLGILFWGKLVSKILFYDVKAIAWVVIYSKFNKMIFSLEGQIELKRFYNYQKYYQRALYYNWSISAYPLIDELISKKDLVYFLWLPTFIR